MSLKRIRGYVGGARERTTDDRVVMPRRIRSATLPQLIDLRLARSISDKIWTTDLVANSLEMLLDYSAGKRRALILHGACPALAPGAYASQEHILAHSLAAGTAGRAPILSYQELLKSRKLPVRFGVILDHEELLRSHTSVAEAWLLETDPLFIACAGGPQRATAYARAYVGAFGPGLLGVLHLVKENLPVGSASMIMTGASRAYVLYGAGTLPQNAEHVLIT